MRCFVNNEWHSQCLDACPSGWACAATHGSRSSGRAVDGQDEDHKGATQFDDGIFGSGATRLSSAISKFAGTAAEELQRAAHDDPKLRTGLPIFLTVVGAFIVLACVTFYRVRRKGGRKRPPRLDFQEVARLSGAMEDIHI